MSRPSSSLKQGKTWAFWNLRHLHMHTAVWVNTFPAPVEVSRKCLCECAHCCITQKNISSGNLEWKIFYSAWIRSNGLPWGLDWRGLLDLRVNYEVCCPILRRVLQPGWWRKFKDLVRRLWRFQLQVCCRVNGAHSQNVSSELVFLKRKHEDGTVSSHSFLNKRGLKHLLLFLWQIHFSRFVLFLVGRVLFDATFGFW